MGWVTVLARCTVGAGAAELAVEGDVRAGECAEGKFSCREVGAKAAVRGVAEIGVKFFGGISSGPLLGVDVGCEKGGRKGGRVVCMW